LNAAIVIAACRGGIIGKADAARFPHGLDVAASTKNTAGAGDNYAAHLLVGVRAFDGVDERIKKLVAANRIAFGRAIQRERDDPVGLLISHEAYHLVVLRVAEGAQMMRV